MREQDWLESGCSRHAVIQVATSRSRLRATTGCASMLGYRSGYTICGIRLERALGRSSRRIHSPLAAIMGHSNLRTIMRYVHPRREAKKQAMKKYAAAMNRRKL